MQFYSPERGSVPSSFFFFLFFFFFALRRQSGSRDQLSLSLSFSLCIFFVSRARGLERSLQIECKEKGVIELRECFGGRSDDLPERRSRSSDSRVGCSYLCICRGLWSFFFFLIGRCLLSTVNSEVKWKVERT